MKIYLHRGYAKVATFLKSCTLGWVSFSEFEITVCGSCKMSQKTKLTILNFFKFNCFAKILNHFFTPLHSKKINYIFANI